MFGAGCALQEIKVKQILVSCRYLIIGVRFIVEKHRAVRVWQHQRISLEIWWQEMWFMPREHLDGVADGQLEQTRGSVPQICRKIVYWLATGGCGRRTTLVLKSLLMYLTEGFRLPSLAVSAVTVPTSARCAGKKQETYIYIYIYIYFKNVI